MRLIAIFITIFSLLPSFAEQREKKPNDAYYKHGILPAAKGTIIYNIEVETAKHNQAHLRYEASPLQETHPTVLKDTVSILVIPTRDKILQEVGDRGTKLKKDTGLKADSSDTAKDIALGLAMGAGLGIIGIPLALMYDKATYDRTYSSSHPNQDLQKAIVVTKNEAGDYVKVCDQVSMLSDYPSNSFFEKFSAYDLKRFSKHKKHRKFSIVEFEPTCFNTAEKRIVVFYTHAQSRHGGYRFVKSTLDDDLKELIAKDFNLEYKTK